MYIFFYLILFVFGIAFASSIVKLAAYVCKRTVVSWRDCALFSLLLFVLTIFDNFLRAGSPVTPHPAIPFLLTFSAEAALAGWFFQNRAVTSTGLRIGWRRGACIGATIFLIGIALKIMLSIFISRLELH